jgi:FkbM family methyltransferase
MNLLQIGTNIANDYFSFLVKSIGNEKIKNLILIEPQKSCNPQIHQCYIGYDFNLENIVINLDETIKKETFFISKYNWLSSLKKEHIENHKTNETPIKVEVDSITLNSLLDKYSITDLDILFIDSEGMDDKIIKSINFEKYNIKKIYYEHVHINNESLVDFLEKNGYVVTKPDYNDDLTSMAVKK